MREQVAVTWLTWNQQNTRPPLDSLMSSMTWTNERTSRSHVTELDPSRTRPPLDSLMSNSMDQWENRSHSRDWAGITKTPSRPWTLGCQVAWPPCTRPLLDTLKWTNGRTGRSNVTELDPSCTRPPLDSLMSSSMDQWENRSQSRDWADPPITRLPSLMSI